jgi:hypothetical protein
MEWYIRHELMVANLFFSLKIDYLKATVRTALEVEAES